MLYRTSKVLRKLSYKGIYMNYSNKVRKSKKIYIRNNFK